MMARQIEEIIFAQLDFTPDELPELVNGHPFVFAGQ
jgi:hypothetical protein